MILVFQDAHPYIGLPSPSDPSAFSLNAFLHKSCFGIGTDGALVVGEDTQIDPVEIEHIEGVAQYQL